MDNFAIATFSSKKQITLFVCFKRQSFAPNPSLINNLISLIINAPHQTPAIDVYKSFFFLFELKHYDQ